jgi:probable HAF family extracellular repeat protein
MTLAAMAVTALAGAAAAQPEYEFVLVDAFTPSYGLRETYLWDVTESGLACGTTNIQIGSTLTYTGFVWTEAGKLAIPVSWPKGISNTGIVVGVNTVYDLSTQVSISPPNLPGTYYGPVFLGVNDAGTAVGYVQTCACSNSQGFLQIPYVWNAATGARSLAVPGANGASRINRNGVVVGWIGGNLPSDGFVFDLAANQYFLASSLFPAAPSAPRTTVVDVNDDGVVVGSRASDDGLATFGFTWSTVSGVTMLPMPPSGYQRAVKPSGINRSGVVVGTIYTTLASTRAFVHDPAHGIRDLNSITTPPDGFTLMWATKVNDQGWIVGYGQGGGGMYKSFVLRPLAAPCYANCDASTSSPVLNVNDFVCFQSRFAAGEPYADCDQNGTLNVNDFVCFQGRFAGGCP